MADSALIDHPNAHLLKGESRDALVRALEHPGEWVEWQTGFPHAKASKTQAYRLRKGQRQVLLTGPYLECLTFRAFKREDGQHTVIARYDA